MYYYCEVKIHNHTGARESLCIFHNKKKMRIRTITDLTDKLTSGKEDC